MFVPKPEGVTVPGNVKLVREMGGDKINVWTSDRCTSAGSKLTFDGQDNVFPVASLPVDLWVEGDAVSSEQRDIRLALRHTNAYVTQRDQVAFTVQAHNLDAQAPSDVVLGQPFQVALSTSAKWTGQGDVTIVTGTPYSTTDRTEVYWDQEKQEHTTPAYTHKFGIKLPDPPQVSIANGQGSFTVTQYTMQPFSIKVTLHTAPQTSATASWSKEHVWAYVKATYIGEPAGSEDEHDWPGYFDNDKPRCALPYGATNLFNSWIVAKKSLGDGGVDVKVRDRGPWFPYKASYPAGSDWYNEYWDDGGWKPLAGFMQGLIRKGDDHLYVINGAGLDLTEKAIEDLGFDFNIYWSGNVYWRLK